MKEKNPQHLYYIKIIPLTISYCMTHKIALNVEINDTRKRPALCQKKKKKKCQIRFKHVTLFFKVEGVFGKECLHNCL